MASLPLRKKELCLNKFKIYWLVISFHRLPFFRQCIVRKLCHISYIILCVDEMTQQCTGEK